MPHPIKLNKLRDLTDKKRDLFNRVLASLVLPKTNIDDLLPRMIKISRLDQTHIEDYYLDNQPLFRFTCFEDTKTGELGIDVQIFKDKEHLQ